MMCPTPVQPLVQPLSVIVSHPLSNPCPTVSLPTPHTPIGLVRPLERAHTLEKGEASLRKQRAQANSGPLVLVENHAQKCGFFGYYSARIAPIV
jgi:hypothetical protein